MFREPYEMSNDEVWAELPEATGDRRGDLLSRLAHEAMHDHEYERALTLAEEAGEEYRQGQFFREYAQTLRTRSHAHENLHQDDIAHQELLEAKAVIEQHGEPAELANIFIELGQFAGRRDQFAEALEYFQSAEIVAAGFSSKDHVNAWTSQKIGFLMKVQGGQMHHVIERMNDTIEMLRGHDGEELISRAHTTLSDALWHQGDHDEAITVGKIALELARASEDPIRLTYVITGLAMMLSELGQHDEADALFDEAAAARGRGLNLHVKSWQAIHNAIAALDAGDLDSSREFHRQAAILFNQESDVFGQIECVRHEAAMYFAMGDHAPALATIRDAIDMACNSGHMEIVRDLMAVFARMAIDSGKPAIALPAFEADPFTQHTGPLLSHDVVQHLAWLALLRAVIGQREQALSLAAKVLEATGAARWPALKALALEARAYALRNTDPIAAASAAARAQATYISIELPKRSLRIGRDFFIEPYETLELVAQHHNDSVEDQQLDAEDDEVDSVITDLEQAKQVRAQREQLEADIAAQLQQDGLSDSQGGESGHGGVA